MATTLKSNRILIVEDDPGIRAVMSRQFRRSGYQVEQAGGAEEALQRLQHVGDRFDVVVTDVHLPGESGVELARRIRGAYPEQPVVFMTGDNDAAIARQALRQGAAGFLLKPFEFAELETVVKKAAVRVVARGAGLAAHVTTPAQVLLAPARPRRTNFAAHVRVALATAALLAIAWVTGVALAPTPLSADARGASLQTENRPVVVPVVIDRTVYRK
jgi:CheY-like chemotaxis protein